MKKAFLILLILFLVTRKTRAQFVLRIIVDDVATKKDGDIYVSGSFNNWNVRDEKYKLKPYGTKRRAIILKDLPPGNYDFKFTRGSNTTWETTAKGEDVPNHNVTLAADTAVNFSVAGWKDDYPEKPKPNTATAQVKLLNSAFVMPQLNRTRRIWTYIPKSYATTKKKFPVIYMHDGQNLFNEQTAAFGEWGIDETLDSLAIKLGKEAIIIGIDNGGDKRMTEYNPYDHKDFGKGEGENYVDFIVKTLKPYIDKKFRTLPDSNHTFIAGSSMGGLISMYAIARYPNTFGGAGIFSPAFWVAPQLIPDIEKSDWGNSFKRFHFYAGGKESAKMIPDMDKVLSVIEQKGRYETNRVVNPVAGHNEAAWRHEFATFFDFIIK